jgi:hypothetical protein
MNVAVIADWGQTRDIAMNPQTYQETGPARRFIGAHPSVGKVNTYFVGSLVVSNGIMIALPKPYRPYFAGSVAAVETHFVVSNNQIGIKINF